MSFDGERACADRACRRAAAGTAVLEPGRYKLWTHPEAQARIATADMRRTEVTINGQELMTRDKVSLRLTLTVAFAIENVVLATHHVDNVRDAVYTAVQLAAHGYVASVTLDELLEGRDAFSRFLNQEVVPKAQAFGVRVDDLGVKDIVLPGEMKTLLNRVIEAEKAAAANVISRREETAATRSLVNTARLMADQPILLRLKKLEAMKESRRKSTKFGSSLVPNTCSHSCPPSCLVGSKVIEFRAKGYSPRASSRRAGRRAPRPRFFGGLTSKQTIGC